MSLSYNQTLLIDCSMSKAETRDGTSWTNKFPQPIKVSSGDTLQIYSCFINKRGSDSSSIEITGEEINGVKDSETTLTLGYYLNATGDNCVPYPYNHFISSIQKNAIVLRDTNNASSTDRVRFWGDWCADMGQRVGSNSSSATLDVMNWNTFAMCSNQDMASSDYVTRLAALQSGAANNFKTYLCDGCSKLDGKRHTAFIFNDTTKKFERYERKLVIKIPPNSYSPSNLATLITNQFSLPNNVSSLLSLENSLTAIQDEKGGYSASFIETPTNPVDFCLYISREQLFNQSDGYTPGSDVPKEINQSPLVKYTTSIISSHTYGYTFAPTQDEYYNLGIADSRVNGPNCKAYTWKMNCGESTREPDQPTISFSLVYFRYPKTLEAAQEISCPNVVDFNHDLKYLNTGLGKPLPTLTNDTTQRDQGGTGYLFSKGDYNGYIITDLEWNSENLLNVKKYFDAQYEEKELIDNTYVLDYTAYPTRPVSRDLTGTDGLIGKGTCKGDVSTFSSDAGQGHRVIMMAASNKRNTSSQSSLGGTNPLYKFGTTDLVYDDSDFELLNFGSDYLGNDPNPKGSMPLGNEEFDFYNPTGTLMGVSPNEKALDTDADGDSSLFTLTGEENGVCDINCSKTAYMSHNQLIKTKTTYLDKKGNTRQFIFPTPENEFFENLGYGYAYRYTSSTGNSDFPSKDYIMLFVDESCGGLNRFVLQYTNPATFPVEKTQSLFWNPFYSSGMCNEAIGKTSGQGSRMGNNVRISGSQGAKAIKNGDIDLTEGNYNTSVIQNGIGAVGGGILAFDDQTSRFFLSDLYTPCYTTNFYSTTTSADPVGDEIVSVNINNVFYNRVDTNFRLNTQGVGTGMTGPIPESAGITYQIMNSFNPIFSYNYNESLSNLGFSVNTPIFLYQTSGVFINKWIESFPTGLNEKNIKGSWNPSTTYIINDIVRYTDGDYYRSRINGNINNIPTTIYWTKINIILENQENFENSLWYKLGFSYSQTHESTYTENISGIDFEFIRNSYTLNQNGSVSTQDQHYSLPVTNNSDLVNVDYDNLLFVNRENLNLFKNSPANNVNTLEIKSQSTKFLAQNLPIRSENPYFIIESDILAVGGIGCNYFSQDAILNAVDICEVSFNSSDFFMYNGSIQHEVSKSYDINVVTHRVRKSNGRLLENQEFSSVIYLANIKVIVGLNPEQLELYQEENEQKEEEYIQNKKRLQGLTKPKLTHRQKLLKQILNQNAETRIQFEGDDIRLNDDDLQELYDNELDREDEEGINLGFDEDGDMINTDTGEKLSEEQKRETLNRMGLEYQREDINPTTVILGRYRNEGILDDTPDPNSIIQQSFEEEPLDEEGINLEQTREQMLLDEAIDKNKPLFTKPGLSLKKLKSQIVEKNMDNPILESKYKRNIQTEPISKEISKEIINKPPIIKTETIGGLEFPTFANIGKKTSLKKNLGRPTRYSQKRTEEPINEKQLENLKERLTERVRGQKSLQKSQESRLEEPYKVMRRLNKN